MLRIFVLIRIRWRTFYNGTRHSTIIGAFVRMLVVIDITSIVQRLYTSHSTVSCEHIKLLKPRSNRLKSNVSTDICYKYMCICIW